MPKCASAKLTSDLFNARWLHKLLPVVVYDIVFCVIKKNVLYHHEDTNIRLCETKIYSILYSGLHYKQATSVENMVMICWRDTEIWVYRYCQGDMGIQVLSRRYGDTGTVKEI